MATGRVPTTANSPLTAKGDLFGYSTTQARVAVGNDGETLVADSSTSTGLRYTAGTVQANPVLNSAMQVWQRGTSFSAPGNSTYQADRWMSYGAGTGITISRQTTSDTTNLPNILYCTRYARNSGSTATNGQYYTQSLENLNSTPFIGKTVTLSFYAKAGANYSATSSVLNSKLISGTGTDQNVINGLTSPTNVINQNNVLTTTWQRFTATATIGSSATQIALQFEFIPTGTAGANDYYELTGVQIDIGSVALPFRTYAATIQGELAACQRYYQRVTGASTSQEYATGIAYSTTACTNFVFSHRVTMRVGPTAIDYSNIRLFDGVTTVAGPTVALTYGGPDISYLDAYGVTGLTQYRPYTLLGSSATTYLGFSAEL